MGGIAILGSTGMLGSCLTQVLSGSFDEIVEVNRKGISVNNSSKVIKLDVLEERNLERAFSGLQIEYVINAVGLIKQLIQDSMPTDRDLAIEINTMFPVRLENFCDYKGIKVIQIGTDCVFSGKTGNYNENDVFDAIDLYGQSKFQGEQALKTTMTIRSSIIGKELNSKVSLLDWFLNQPRNADVKGFTNHYWNGITTLAFSKIVTGIIQQDEFRSEIIHLIPENKVSKFELLNDFMQSFNRNDVNLLPTQAENSVDRTLGTNYPLRNSILWRNAGYNSVPTIAELVSEFAEWCEIR